MADLGFQERSQEPPGFRAPWEQLEKKLERELGRFEAKLDGMMSDLVSEQRIQRLAILQVNSRVARLEQSLEQRQGGITKEDVRQALAESIQDVMNLRQILLVLGVPSGILGVLLILREVIGGF